MREKYILGIDQSTSGTKALLFDGKGDLTGRHDLPHRQIINGIGWVGHNPEEIYANTLAAVKGVIEKTGAEKSKIAGAGISNQRETSVVWDKATGKPVHDAIVWQCARAENICKRIEEAGCADKIKAITGLNLSPYFSAGKIAWILENIPGVKFKNLCAGTIDSWLVYKLTGNFRTDYSNASRTQLFDLTALAWSDEVCGYFGIDPDILPQACGSDSCFGYTDFGGFLDSPVPVHGVMGDSHGALFGQGCHKPGMMKATYGTGSSIMMNIGNAPVFGGDGIVTSVAWGLGGQAEYVLEGNINYAGAVMKWLCEDLGLLESPALASEYAEKANAGDETYLVPAFSGLGAPYWDSGAKAIICGMTRLTGKAEIIKAASECAAYQIADIIRAMRACANISPDSLRVDGGPTRDKYLMQFQSDILNLPVLVPANEELSGIGAAYAAGIAMGIYDKEELFSRREIYKYVPCMDVRIREKKLNGWKSAVQMVLR
jgi:glycerol kinase